MNTQDHASQQLASTVKTFLEAVNAGVFEAAEGQEHRATGITDALQKALAYFIGHVEA